MTVEETLICDLCCALTNRGQLDDREQLELLERTIRYLEARIRARARPKLTLVWAEGRLIPVTRYFRRN